MGSVRDEKTRLRSGDEGAPVEGPGVRLTRP